MTHSPCEQYREDIIALAFGELNSKATVTIQTHIASCPECQAFLKALNEEEDKIRSTFQKIEARGERLVHCFLGQLGGEEAESCRAGLNAHGSWTRSVKKRISKLAVAAIIVIAALLGVRGVLDLASPAFGIEDVVNAFEQMDWYHYIVELENADPNSPSSTMGVEHTEYWGNVPEMCLVTKTRQGEICYTEERLGKTARYDPNTQTITIEYREPDANPEVYASFSDMVMKGFEEAKKKGQEISYAECLYQGEAATRITMSIDDEFLGSMAMVVASQTLLPLHAVVNVQDPNGSTVSYSAAFDYFATGPKDIYEAGAPRDATVEVIDKRPSVELHAIMARIQDVHDNLYKNYILIETEASGKQAYIDTVSIIYRNNKHCRHERHFVFKPGDAYHAMWPVYSAAMGTRFESILKWAQDNRSGSARVHLYDGQYYQRFERNDADQWSTEKREYSPRHNPNGGRDLARIGWPLFSHQAKVIENEFSKTHDLICIETILSEIKKGKLASAASRRLQYLDPERDHMCIRSETYRYNIELAKPLDESFEFDPNRFPSELSSVTEVTEFNQMADGKWTPKTIQLYRTGWNSEGELLPLRIVATRSIYLQINPEFPVDLFNPKKVIPQDEQAEPSLRQSYDSIVEDTIATIDRQKDWPEPRKLVESYWQARARKDYDLMALYWPGSALWNEKRLRTETPVEYVFGDAVISTDGAYVPYASKAYYEQHGGYKLKMWLTDKMSAKGRYYIISGN